VFWTYESRDDCICADDDRHEWRDVFFPAAVGVMGEDGGVGGGFTGGGVGGVGFIAETRGAVVRGGNSWSVWGESV
jgi:hypothetical protein